MRLMSETDTWAQKMDGPVHAALTIVVLLAGFATASPAIAQRGVRASVPDTANLSRTVNSGSQSQLWFGWAITPDCQVLRGWNVAVIRLPANGVANLQKTNRVIDESWLSRRHLSPRQIEFASYCIGRTVPVITLNYRSKRGYRGVDSLQFVVTTADSNRSRTVEVSIDVR